MAQDKDIKIVDEKICITSSALYKLLEINESTLVDWGQKGCPKVARGWWAISEVLRWRGLIGTGGIKTSENLEDENLQELKLKAEIKYKESQIVINDFKNAISQGEYHKATDCNADMNYQFAVLKRLLLGLSRTIATDLSGFVEQTHCRRMENMVNERIKDWLRQVSKGNEKYKP